MCEVCEHGTNRLCPSPPAEDREASLVCRRGSQIVRPGANMCSRRAHCRPLSRFDRLPVQQVARRASVSRPAVWRWQARYAEQGVEGLLRDTNRKPGRAPLSAKVVAKVMDLTCSEPPGHATHWTGRGMAKVSSSASACAPCSLWQAHRLQPHRDSHLQALQRSRAFAEKVHENIVGLYTDPPKHTVVVSIDEKSQIQALDCTQPGLPLQARKMRDDDP